MPLRSISTKEVGEALIFTRTGLPLKIVSDQGSQFVRSVMSDLCKLLGMDKVQTTSPYPGQWPSGEVSWLAKAYVG